MAKRKNRVAPIEHECRQLENLKVLEPNSTTPEARELSNALVDIALAALEEVRNLELGEEPQLKRLETLVELMDTLPKRSVSSRLHRLLIQLYIDIHRVAFR